MTSETEPISRPQPREVKYPTGEVRSLARQLLKDFKTVIDRKFPLTQIGQQSEFFNEAVSDSDVINILYLPADASRKDPEEQIKVSSSADNTTIAIVSDEANSEISAQTFDSSDDSQPPVLVETTKNTPEAASKAREMLEKLKALKNFNLLHPAKKA